MIVSSLLTETTGHAEGSHRACRARTERSSPVDGRGGYKFASGIASPISMTGMSSRTG